MQSANYALTILRQMEDELREIERLEEEISAGEKAWNEGTDPFEMAGCDPSDQFVKGEEIAGRRETLLELADELDEALGRKKS